MMRPSKIDVSFHNLSLQPADVKVYKVSALARAHSPPAPSAVIQEPTKR